MRKAADRAGKRRRHGAKRTAGAREVQRLPVGRTQMRRSLHLRTVHPTADRERTVEHRGRQRQRSRQPGRMKRHRGSMAKGGDNQERAITETRNSRGRGRTGMSPRATWRRDWRRTDVRMDEIAGTTEDVRRTEDAGTDSRRAALPR